MSGRSRAAVARSYRVERSVVGVLGFLLLAAGAVALLAGQGWLGGFRAGRPVLDPVAVDVVRAHLLVARVMAIAAGMVLLVAGLAWFVRAFRPEGKPNLRLQEEDDDQLLVVTSAAIADAVESDCAGLAGVSKARVRAVGTADGPALRLSLWLDEGTDVREVWQQLDGHVLARARESLGLQRLPTAIRLEMDTAAAQRVQ